MKRTLLVPFFLLGFFLFAIFIFSSSHSAQADAIIPLDDAARGTVNTGLNANDPECKGALQVHTSPNGKTHCSHGADPAPRGFDIRKKVSPIITAEAKPGSSTAPTPTPAPSSGIVCDGDGVSGYRVQVLYAHAADVADSYAIYAASFKTWVAGVDAIFNTSAAQTGGTRHVRFVHDANCSPIIPNVTLSTTGDDTFANTINELEALGYNRGDRKYLVFMDARVYCGIATMAMDDSASALNANNNGDTFGRIDAGCWSDVIPAHELMHQLGGVQLSAPHSSGEAHCYDGYDDMCRPTNGTALQIVCSDTAQSNLFDCGHDDYYHTNPPRGSYLATHWNSANNQFLILPKSRGK